MRIVESCTDARGRWLVLAIEIKPIVLSAAKWMVSSICSSENSDVRLGYLSVAERRVTAFSTTPK